jgi:nucleotide-binding universal stress UspA family protein
LFEGLLSEQGLNAISKALNSPEPAKALALLIYNVIEPAQVASMDSDTPISPRVWLASGGAVDELTDELYELAGALGVDEEMLEEIFPSVKQEVAAILQKRGQDLQQQGMSASQPQPSPAPMPGGM